MRRAGMPPWETYVALMQAPHSLLADQFPMRHAFRIYRSGRKSFQTYARPLLASSLFQKPFGRHARRVLVVYFPNDVGVSQIDPFFYYHDALQARHNVEFRVYSLPEFMASDRDGPCGADIVLLQSWYELTDDERTVLFGKLQQFHPDAKVVYLDWFAPLDLRLAELLNDKVSVYVKKQIFRDSSQYELPTIGETNLSDYYAKLYGISLNSVQYNVPKEFEKKILLGPGFFTSYSLTREFRRKPPPAGPRPIDLNARITTRKSDWYGTMRRHACEAVKAIADCRAVTDVGLSRREYFAELRRSKLCFSPFGYGEVCWRDFEAMMTGSLLLKPDVSHLTTDPDVFVAGETYVPIAWDFSDLAEKVAHYLRHDDERQRIAANAYAIVHDYIANGGFIRFADRVFSS
jgi:glycosyltransferase involved in cell wall biosynthesis